MNLGSPVKRMNLSQYCEKNLSKSKKNSSKKKKKHEKTKNVYSHTQPGCRLLGDPATNSPAHRSPQTRTFWNCGGWDSDGDSESVGILGPKV
jgi:hypothetical protein